MRQLVQTTTLTRRVTSTRLKGTCLQYTTPAIPITETAARPSHIGRPRLAIVSIKHFSAASVGSGFWPPPPVHQSYHASSVAYERNMAWTNSRRTQGV